MKITRIEKNCMGTLSINAKFKGMRKEQDFIVYPMHEGMNTDKIKIQSDTRIGYINLIDGSVSLCPPKSSGAYNVDLMFIKLIDCIDKKELAGLKFRLIQTSSKNAGDNALHVITDNSGAEKVSIF